MQIDSKDKFIKDVVHDEIVFRQPWAIEILKSKEFNRLSRIKQLGLTCRLFPNATHTRYAHSLGVYELANRVCKQIHCLNEKDKAELCVAALIHDFGHGPHSHMFEGYTQINHEKYSKDIILDPTTDVNKILRKYKINPKNVCAILDHKHKNSIVNDLISSQIDVDRMDYLSRDSHFTGACYGNIDISMIIKWIVVKNNKICFYPKAISSIENFLLARYHMFDAVYERPKTVALQELIRKMLQRFKYIYKHKPKTIVDKYSMVEFFKPWLENKDFTVNQYLLIDDMKLEMFIDQMQYENDDYIKEAFNLYNYFFNTDYKSIRYSKQIALKYKKQFSKTTKFPDLYMHKCRIKTKSIYKIDDQPILIYNDATGKITPLETESLLIKKLDKVTKPLDVLVIHNNK